MFQFFLLVLLFLQWMLISYLLVSRHQNIYPSVPTCSTPQNTKSQLNQEANNEAPIVLTKNDANNIKKNRFRGVAATVMLDSPKWFQRRFSVMVSNVAFNIPNDWAIQIFHTGSGSSEVGITINPGMMRFAEENDSIIFTRIPDELLAKFGTKKKFLYLTHSWIWEELVADRVLIFSGNGVMCSNAKLSLRSKDDADYSRFLYELDYLGTPWRQLNGQGGDGTVSLRHRQAMLSVLKEVPYDGQEDDDSYFVSSMLQINKKRGTEVYNVASREHTELFAGTHLFNETISPPMVIAGIMENLDHDKRDALLEICPESKVFFPALHHPSCFGAHPKSDECALHICALKDETKRKGGC